MLRGFLAVLLFGTVLHGSPVQTMEAFLDAVYRRDGQAVYDMLSLENQAALSLMMAMARLQPASYAQRFSADTGCTVSEREVASWTEPDLVRAVLEAPVLVTLLPDRDRVLCLHRGMRGDTAVVVCSVTWPTGETEEADFALVMQQGRWRVGQPFLPDGR